jgi:hypothetical protein
LPENDAPAEFSTPVEARLAESTSVKAHRGRAAGPPASVPSSMTIWSSLMRATLRMMALLVLEGADGAKAANSTAGTA